MALVSVVCIVDSWWLHGPAGASVGALVGFGTWENIDEVLDKTLPPGINLTFLSSQHT